MYSSPTSVPAQAMQLWLALRMRILASSYGCTDSTISHADLLPRRPAVAMKSSSITHWMKLSPITGAASSQPVAARTRSRHSGGGRGVMRSTIAFGQLVLACTQAQQRGVAGRSMNSQQPARKRSPLWRRLSQFSSVTGAARRARLRARRIAASAP